MEQKKQEWDDQEERDISNQDMNATESLNKREDETEPFNEDGENGQENTAKGRESNLKDAERNREDLSDRGEDEG